MIKWISNDITTGGGAVHFGVVLAGIRIKEEASDGDPVRGRPLVFAEALNKIDSYIFKKKIE